LAEEVKEETKTEEPVKVQAPVKVLGADSEKARRGTLDRR
jgi:hypothetical protein